MLGWELPPHNSGGLGVASYQLCRALANKGLSIEFILPHSTTGYNIDFMTLRSATQYSAHNFLQAFASYEASSWLTSLSSRSSSNQQFLYTEGVERLVEEISFDIIHAHDWLTFRAALRAREITGRPTILHVHSVESDRAGSNFGNPLVHEIERTSLMLADKIIAVSQHTKNAIVRDYGIPPGQIQVVHNSVTKDDLVPIEPTNAYRYLTAMKSRGYKVIVNVGRLTVQKGLPNFLKAIKEVVVREPRTLFLIVGSGDQQQELIELSAELGISRHVIFAGFQRGKNWRDAYAVGDLFVMPSISEPFGLTPLEATSYGTASLISKQSGVSEVLHSCLKVDFWDVYEMANQITSALRSNALRQELLTGARREYDRLSWGASADVLTDIYAEVTEGSLV